MILAVAWVVICILLIVGGAATAGGVTGRRSRIREGRRLLLETFLDLYQGDA